MTIKIPYLEIDSKEDFCGVYAIYNIINNKFYIGSAKNFFERRYDHLYLLGSNKHDNIHLQRAWNKYGKENFIWLCLEKTTEENQFLIEQKYINSLDATNPSIGYNINPNAIKPPICKRKKGIIPGWISPIKGRKHSKETIAKMIKAKSTKKYLWTEEDKLNIANKNSRIFKFIDCEGRIMEGKNLKKFCLDNNLSFSNLYNVHEGNILHWKGIIKFCESEEEKIIREKITENQNNIKKLPKEYILEREDGSTQKIKNLYAHCIENNLNYDKMRGIVRGCMRTPYKGYISFIMKNSLIKLNKS